MLTPEELILFKYFAANDRTVPLDEILLKFRKMGDKNTIFNLLCTLEEQALIDEAPHTNAWMISTYGKQIQGNPISRLIGI